MPGVQKEPQRRQKSLPWRYRQLGKLPLPIPPRESVPILQTFRLPNCFCRHTLSRVPKHTCNLAQPSWKVFPSQKRTNTEPPSPITSSSPRSLKVEKDAPSHSLKPIFISHSWMGLFIHGKNHTHTERPWTSTFFISSCDHSHPLSPCQCRTHFKPLSDLDSHQHGGCWTAQVYVHGDDLGEVPRWYPALRRMGKQVKGVQWRRNRAVCKSTDPVVCSSQ